MKELLLEFLSNILKEAGKSFKAVRKDADGERVVVFDSQENFEAKQKYPGQGVTYRPYNPSTDSKLEKEPGIKGQDIDVAMRGGYAPEPKLMGKSKTTSGTKPRKISKSDSTGAIIFDEPIKTPEGNEVNAFITPEKLKPISDAVNAKVDIDRATTDELSDVDIEMHRRRELPETSDDYYNRMEERGFVAGPESTAHFDDSTRQILRDNGVSDHHVELLERAANTVLKGDIPPFSELTGGSAGAGKAPAQAGELMAGVLMTIRDSDDREKVAMFLTQMIQNTEDQLGKPILDVDWIEAALNQSEAFNAIMDSEHGKGQWEVEGFAWDTPEDIAGIGLDARNKGFSTDVALRVKVSGRDNAVVARISLKKNGKIFLLNGAISDVVVFAVQALDDVERNEYNELDSLRLQAVSKSSTDEERKEAIEKIKTKFKITSATKALTAAKARIEELEEKALVNLPSDIREKVELVKTFSSRQHTSGVNLAGQLSGKPSDTETAAQKMRSVTKPKPWKAEDVETAIAAHKALSSLPQTATESEMIQALQNAGVVASPKDRFLKATVLAAELESHRNPEFRAAVTAHCNLAVEAGNAAVDAAVLNDDMLKGLMYKLQETFPIRVIASGEESMCLGGVAVSRKTLTEMFGTDNLDEIRDGLTVVTRQTDDDPPEEERILIFRAEANGIQIPIALVGARQKGRGYQGSIGLEFNATPEFECAAANANAKIDMNNDANAKIVARCEKQAAKAAIKKQPVKQTK